MSYHVATAGFGRAAGPFCLCILAGVVGGYAVQELMTAGGHLEETAKNYGVAITGVGIGAGLLTGLRTVLSYVDGYRKCVRAVLRQHARELPEPQRSVALKRAESDDEEVLGEELKKAGFLMRYDALLHEAFVPRRFRKAAGFTGISTLAALGASSSADFEDDFTSASHNYPSVNVDGTPMIGGSGIDVNGNTYGNTND